MHVTSLHQNLFHFQSQISPQSTRPFNVVRIHLKYCFGTDNDEQRVRCFLVDHEGYLVAHPSLLAPSASYTPATNVPPHITHQASHLLMRVADVCGSSNIMCSSSMTINSITFFSDFLARHSSLLRNRTFVSLTTGASGIHGVIRRWCRTAE